MARLTEYAVPLLCPLHATLHADHQNLSYSPPELAFSKGKAARADGGHSGGRDG